MYDFSIKKLAKSPWCRYLVTNLTQLGFADAWKNQNIPNTKSFYLLVKEKVYDHYANVWSSEIQAYSSLDTYSQFKLSHGMEKYFSIIKDKRHLTALIRLRLHSHTLAIETGRHSRQITPRNQRLCLYCNENKIEDEAHFLITCTLYDSLRETLLPHINHISDEKGKYIFLMQSATPNIIRETARFIYKAFNKRNQQDYN